MTSIGWYGPLIDLSKSSSHIGDFVQILVYVHRCTPVQYKLFNGGGQVIRTDIQVGDDSRPFFSVSLWQKETVLAADVILLQNVKITKYGDVVEARTVQCSSLLCLVSRESLVSKGVDDLVTDCRVGSATKNKLRKVIEWSKRFAPNVPKIGSKSFQGKETRNWKVQEEGKSKDCFSLSEVSHLTNSCKATFYASIGELFLPFTWRTLDESEKERMFIRRRVFEMENNHLVEDLICTGCQICGASLCLENGSGLQKNNVQFYCKKSSNLLHVVGFIYRPFMLYVWDQTEYIPLLVTNKSAELLFGNIRADSVHLSYTTQKPHQKLNPKGVNNYQEATIYTKIDNGLAGSCSQGKCGNNKIPNFYLIWLILLKVLLLQGKNSPLKFEVAVNAGLDAEDGRFELVCVSMPCLSKTGTLLQ